MSESDRLTWAFVCFVLPLGHCTPVMQNAKARNPPMMMIGMRNDNAFVLSGKNYTVYPIGLIAQWYARSTWMRKIVGSNPTGTVFCVAFISFRFLHDEMRNDDADDCL